MDRWSQGAKGADGIRRKRVQTLGDPLRKQVTEVKEMMYQRTVKGITEQTIDGAIDGAIRLQVLLDNWSGLIEERLEAKLEGRLEGKEPGEAGQSLVEYAIALALIAIAAMGAVQALGGGVGNLFQRLVARIQGIG